MNKQELLELILNGPVRGLKNACSGRNISERKLEGAVKDITGNQVEPQEVLVVQDQTLFGSASDGMVFTFDSLYIKPSFDDIFSCRYTEISEVRLISKAMRFLDQVEIVLESGHKYTIKGNVHIEPENFMIWLREVVQGSKDLFSSSHSEVYADAAGGAGARNAFGDGASQHASAVAHSYTKIILDPQTDITVLEQQAMRMGINIIKPPTVPPLMYNDIMRLFTERSCVLGRNVFWWPKIPIRKLSGAVNAIAKNLVKPEEVTVIFDATVFGSSTDGILFTRTKLFFKDVADDPTSMELADIKSIEPFSKLGLFKTVRFHMQDGRAIELPTFQCIEDMDTFVIWLNAVINMAKYEDSLVKELESRGVTSPTALGSPERFYEDHNSAAFHPDPKYRDAIDVQVEDVAVSKVESESQSQRAPEVDNAGQDATFRDSEFGADKSYGSDRGYGSKSTPPSSSQDWRQARHGSDSDAVAAAAAAADAAANAATNTQAFPVQQPKSMPVKPQLPAALSLDLFVLLTKEFGYALDNSYGAPNIPERKLNGAISDIAKNEVEPNEVLLVCDDTVFGSATDGMLFSKTKMYVKALMEDARAFEYTNVANVGTYQKSEKDLGVRIYLKDGGTFNMPAMSTVYEDAQRFADWLGAVCQTAQYEIAMAQYTGESQNTKLARRNLDQMPHDIQYKYMQIISNFLLADDGHVDAREAGIFYSLLARIKLTAQDRYQLRMYQSDASKLVPTQQLVQEITANLDRLASQEIINSLVKDMINIHLNAKNAVSVYKGDKASSAESDQSYLSNPFIQRFAQDNGVTQEQLKVIKQAIDADNKIFDDNIDDAGLNSALANVAAAAGAVGVPLAALYFSGSVIGLSAAGITSGLSALGLGGLFGLSGMATGIGAVILLGLGANKGIKILTGQSERDSRARKQAMLFAVNRQLTKSINLLVEDINTFTQELIKQVRETQALEMDVVSKERELASLLDRLESLGVFSQGSDLMVADSAIVETKAYRQNLPLVLNIDRLRAITDEPTKRPFFDEILKLYKQGTEVDDDGKTVTVYRLCDDLSCDEAEFLSQALDKLEYFSVSGLAKSGIASIKSLWS